MRADQCVKCAGCGYLWAYVGGFYLWVVCPYCEGA